MTIKRNVNIDTYIEAVEDIARGFFNEDGDYVPHLGRINSIAAFLDYFVDDPEFHENTDVNEILSNEELIQAYNKEIVHFGGLNFAAAYADALTIVEHRKNSFYNLANFIKKYLTPESIEKYGFLIHQALDNARNQNQKE